MCFRRPAFSRAFQLDVEDLQHSRILVAHVDEDFLGFHGPGRDQHAFEELVRTAFEIVAVLEGAGLAFVAVDGHVARAFFGAHKRPLAPGGEAGAAEAAQTAVRERGDDLIDGAGARETFPEDFVAAFFLIGGEVLVFGDRGVQIAFLDNLLDLRDGGLGNMLVADFGSGRDVTGADAWSAKDANLRHVFSAEHGNQLFGPGQHAGEAVADADGDRFRLLFAVLDHVEVGVEGGNFVDFGHRDAQQFSQRMDVAGGQALLGVLDLVQVFDEQRTLVGTLADQLLYGCCFERLQLAALLVCGSLPPAGARMIGAFFKRECAVAGLGHGRPRSRVPRSHRAPAGLPQSAAEHSARPLNRAPVVGTWDEQPGYACALRSAPCPLQVVASRKPSLVSIEKSYRSTKADL